MSRRMTAQTGSTSIYLLMLMTMVSVLSLTYIAMINESYLRSNEIISKEKARMVVESSALTMEKLIAVLKSKSPAVAIDNHVLGRLACQLNHSTYTLNSCTSSTEIAADQGLLQFSYPNSKVNFIYDHASNRFVAIGKVGFRGLSSWGQRQMKMMLDFDSVDVISGNSNEYTNQNNNENNNENTVAARADAEDNTKLLYTHAASPVFTDSLYNGGDTYNLFETCPAIGCSTTKKLAASNVKFNAEPSPSTAYNDGPFTNMFNARFNELFAMKPTNNTLPWTPSNTTNGNCTISIGPNDYKDGTYVESGSNDTVKVLNGFSTNCNIDLYFDEGGSPSNNVLKINGNLISGAHITVKNTMSKKFWITGNLHAGKNITSASGVTIQTNGFYVDGHMIAGGDIRMAFQTQIKVGGTMSSKGTIQFKRAVDNGLYVGQDVIAENGIEFGVNSATDPVAGMYVTRDVIVRNGHFIVKGTMKGLWIKGDLYVPNGNVEFQNMIENGTNQTYKAVLNKSDYDGGQKSDVEGNVLCRAFKVTNSIDKLIIKKSLYIDQVSGNTDQGSFTGNSMKHFFVGGNILAKRGFEFTGAVSTTNGFKVGTHPNDNPGGSGYLLALNQVKFNENSGLVYASKMIGSRDQAIHFGKSKVTAAGVNGVPTAGYIFAGVWSGGLTSPIMPPMMDLIYKKPVLIFNELVTMGDSSATTQPVDGTVRDVIIE